MDAPVTTPQQFLPRTDPPTPDLAVATRGLTKSYGRQVALTVCVVAGLWVTGWVMGWLLLVLLPVVLGPAPSGSGSLVVNVLTLPPILLTLGVLVAVYVGVRVLRLVVRARGLPVR